MSSDNHEAVTYWVSSHAGRYDAHFRFGGTPADHDAAQAYEMRTCEELEEKAHAHGFDLKAHRTPYKEERTSTVIGYSYQFMDPGELLKAMQLLHVPYSAADPSVDLEKLAASYRAARESFTPGTPVFSLQLKGGAMTLTASSQPLWDYLTMAKIMDLVPGELSGRISSATREIAFGNAGKALEFIRYYVADSMGCSPEQLLPASALAALSEKSRHSLPG